MMNEAGEGEGPESTGPWSSQRGNCDLWPVGDGMDMV